MSSWLALKLTACRRCVLGSHAQHYVRRPLRRCSGHSSISWLTSARRVRVPRPQCLRHAYVMPTSYGGGPVPTNVEITCPTMRCDPPGGGGGGGVSVLLVWCGINTRSENGSSFTGDVNSMSVANCAIVFGPNLIWPKGGGPYVPAAATTPLRLCIVSPGLY